MNAHLEIIRDPAETPDIPAQEFATIFVDSEDNRTSAFLAGTELEDIARCDKPVISSRSGFLRRKKHYDCGAQALKLYAIRKHLKQKKLP